MAAKNKFPAGNDYGAQGHQNKNFGEDGNRGKLCTRALLMTIMSKGLDADGSPKTLRKMFSTLLARAEQGDLEAIDWIVTRIDGKATENINLGGQPGNPLITGIRIVIVDPQTNGIADRGSAQTIELARSDGPSTTQ